MIYVWWRTASWCFGQCLTTSLCCFNLLVLSLWGLPGCLSNKEPACYARDMGSILGLRRSPGKGTGNLLQYICLVNPMDRGAWWATVHSVSSFIHSSDPSGLRVLASTAERRNSSECQPNAWLVLLRMPLDGDSAMEKCYKIFPNSVTTTDWSHILLGGFGSKLNMWIKRLDNQITLKNSLHDSHTETPKQIILVSPCILTVASISPWE